MSVTFLTDKDGVAVTCTSSGNLITVNDAATMPLQGLYIYGKTTQDGTPSPDAPMELVSAGDDGSIGVTVCGKNLFDKNKYTASMLFVDTAINAFTDAGDFRSVIIPIAPGTMYTVSKSTATIMRVGTSVRYPEAGAAMTKFANHSAASTAPLTVTSGDSDHWMLVQLFVNADIGTEYGSIDANIANLMVEVGSAATAYEPCTAQSLTLSTPNGLPGIPVTSGGNYTDENGQRWFCDEIDLERGVYVQRIGKMVYDGVNLLFRDISAANKFSGTTQDGRFSASFDCENVICTHYPFARFGLDSSSVTKDKTFSVYRNQAALTSGGIYIYDTGFASAAELNAYLAENPLTVLYAMLEEKIIGLSAEEIAAYTALHTSKPITTVINDSGTGMRLDYSADTKTYIDNKFAELAAAMVSNT